jgi:hypothetical protein
MQHLRRHVEINQNCALPGQTSSHSSVRMRLRRACLGRVRPPQLAASLRYTHRRMIGLGAWICRERFSDLAAHGWRGAPTVPKRSARQWFQSGRPNSQPQILLNLGTPCADINQPGDFRGPVTDPTPPSDHTPLGRRCAFLRCPNLDCGAS